MSNAFYSEGEQRAAAVNRLFTSIAARYDLVNDLQSFGLHRRWKRAVAHSTATRPGDLALDVCCGTGDIACALAGKGVRVFGLDFNFPMLAIAQKKVAAEREPRPLFLLGDALKIPFPDNSFEAVTIGYGLRNLASWEAGLREMHRVLKPGGRLVALEFGKPQNRVLRAFYFAYLRAFLPVLGWLLCRNAAAYAYILESLKRYPAQEEVARALNAMGFEKVRVTNLVAGTMSIHSGEKRRGNT